MRMRRGPGRHYKPRVGVHYRADFDGVVWQKTVARHITHVVFGRKAGKRWEPLLWAESAQKAEQHVRDRQRLPGVWPELTIIPASREGESKGY